MKKLLVVVDMQHDFINGALGSNEAVAIVKNVARKIEDWDGDVVATRDTHDENYLNTREGKYLPVKHCIKGTWGWEINDSVAKALEEKIEQGCRVSIINKGSFGSLDIGTICSKYDYVEFVGLCTDICVISNVIIAKNTNPELDIAVDASCCAGVTPESHNAALIAMKSCQVEVI